MISLGTCRTLVALDPCRPRWPDRAGLARHSRITRRPRRAFLQTELRQLLLQSVDAILQDQQGIDGCCLWLLFVRPGGLLFILCFRQCRSPLKIGMRGATRHQDSDH